MVEADRQTGPFGCWDLVLGDFYLDIPGGRRPEQPPLLPPQAFPPPLVVSI